MGAKASTPARSPSPPAEHHDGTEVSGGNDDDPWPLEFRAGLKRIVLLERAIKEAVEVRPRAARDNLEIQRLFKISEHASTNLETKGEKFVGVLENGGPFPQNVEEENRRALKLYDDARDDVMAFVEMVDSGATSGGERHDQRLDEGYDSDKVAVFTNGEAETVIEGAQDLAGENAEEPARPKVGQETGGGVEELETIASAALSLQDKTEHASPLLAPSKSCGESALDDENLGLGASQTAADGALQIEESRGEAAMTSRKGDIAGIIIEERLKRLAWLLERNLYSSHRSLLKLQLHEQQCQNKRLRQMIETTTQDQRDSTEKQGGAGGVSADARSLEEPEVGEKVPGRNASRQGGGDPAVQSPPQVQSQSQLQRRGGRAFHGAKKGGKGSGMRKTLAARIVELEREATKPPKKRKVFGKR